MPTHASGSANLDFGSLVQADRVHRSVYTDPAVFDEEMARIFGFVWLYVGHESQVPRAGDYVTAWMGREPVILIRHQDGLLHVLSNRCPHRGAMIVTEERGSSGELLRCPYHGWTFRTNGELLLAPMRDAYAGRYDLSDRACFGMRRVTRVATHRGFVFASLAPEGAPLPDLLTYLGATAACIDLIVDRSPEGEVDVSGGVHRYRVRANWKQQLENVNDAYHANFAHACSTDDRNRQFKRRYGDSTGPYMDDAERQSKWDSMTVTALDWGSSYIGAMPFNHKDRAGPLVEAHRAALRERHPPERVEAIMEERFHNATVYPSVVFQLASSHVRVLRPVAADCTEIRVYPIRLKGAPEEINRQLVRYLNITHAAASLIQTDDVEMFRRVQAGLASEGLDWVWFNRYMGDESEHNGVRRSRAGTSELGMRNQYRSWLRYMDAAPA